MRAHQPVTFTAVADLAKVGRGTLYRDGELRAVIDEHRTHQADARTLTGLAHEIAHLRCTRSGSRQRPPSRGATPAARTAKQSKNKLMTSASRPHGPDRGLAGQSYDNALAESTIGQIKAELVHRRGPWRTVEQLEFALFEYLDWWNHCRLHGEIGIITPAEQEAAHYAQHRPLSEAGSQ